MQSDSIVATFFRSVAITSRALCERQVLLIYLLRHQSVGAFVVCGSLSVFFFRWNKKQRTIAFVRSVAKNLIFQIVNFSRVNADIKYVCGVGTEFESQNQVCVQHAVPPMEMIRMNLARWMWKRS